MGVKLNELASGERFKARDGAKTLQYAGYRGHEQYDDSYVTITFQVGGLGGNGVHTLEEIQQDCACEFYSHSRGGGRSGPNKLQ